MYNVQVFIEMYEDEHDNHGFNTCLDPDKLKADLSLKSEKLRITIILFVHVNCILIIVPFRYKTAIISKCNIFHTSVSYGFQLVF